MKVNIDDLIDFRRDDDVSLYARVGAEYFIPIIVFVALCIFLFILNLLSCCLCK